MVNSDVGDHRTIDASTRRMVERIATFIVTSLASARFPGNKDFSLDLKEPLMNVFKGEKNLNQQLLSKATSLIQHAIAYHNTTSNIKLELKCDISNPTLFQTNKPIPHSDVEQLIRSIAYTGEVQNSKKQLAFNQIKSIQL